MAKKLSSTNVAGIVSLSSQMQSGFMRNIDPRAYSSGTNIITLSGARETASPAASFSMAGKSNTLTIASWGQQGGPVASIPDLPHVPPASISNGVFGLNGAAGRFPTFGQLYTSTNTDGLPKVQVVNQNGSHQ